MKTINVKQPINLKVVKFELDFSQLIAEKAEEKKTPKKIKVPKVLINQKRKTEVPAPPLVSSGNQKRNIKDLVEELLDELYADQRWNGQNGDYSRGSTSAGSLASSQSNYEDQSETIEISFLETLDFKELQTQVWEWENRLQQAGEKLAKYVRIRDRLKRQQKRLCGAFSVLLRHISE